MKTNGRAVDVGNTSQSRMTEEGSTPLGGSLNPHPTQQEDVPREIDHLLPRATSARKRYLPLIQFLTSALLIMMPLGTIRLWARLQPALAAYISHHTGSDRSLQPVLVAALLAMPPAMLAASWAVETYKKPLIIGLVGAVTSGIALLLASFCKSVASLATTLGVLHSVGVGCSYIVPLYYIPECFPNNMGLMLGLVTGAVVLGAIVLNYIMGKLLGRSELDCDTSVVIEKEVYDKIPMMFRVVACYVAGSVGIGSICLPKPREVKLWKYSPPPADSLLSLPHPHGDHRSANALTPTYHSFLNSRIQNQPETTPPSQVPRGTKLLQTGHFWLLPIMAFIFSINGSIIEQNYRDIGTEVTGLTVTDASNVCNYLLLSSLIGRILWGLLSDMVGYHVTLLSISVVMGSLLMSYGFIHSAGVFQLWTCLLFFAFNGIYSGLPAAVAHIFGTENFTFNYSIAFLGLGFGSGVAALMSSLVRDSLNKGQTMLIVMAFLAGSANLLIFPVRFIFTMSSESSQGHMNSHTRQSSVRSASYLRAPSASSSTASLRSPRETPTIRTSPRRPAPPPRGKRGSGQTPHLEGVSLWEQHCRTNSVISETSITATPSTRKFFSTLPAPVPRGAKQEAAPSRTPSPPNVPLGVQENVSDAGSRTAQQGLPATPEDLPPPYDSLEDIRKDVSLSTTSVSTTPQPHPAASSSSVYQPFQPYE
eukprot:Sspe_Gene.69657::Locus_41071_Transcript_1_1_Confidence_1.000_Length_2351::g.69657::m.69657